MWCSDEQALAVSLAVFSETNEVKVLYLSLGEVQVNSNFIAAKAGQVIVMSELSLQLSQLLLSEGCPFLPCLAV